VAVVKWLGGIAFLAVIGLLIWMEALTYDRDITQIQGLPTLTMVALAVSELLRR
jgi:hypothetical protein